MRRQSLVPVLLSGLTTPVLQSTVLANPRLINASQRTTEAA